VGRDAAALNGALSPQAFAPLLAGSFARMLGLWRSSEPEAFAQAWLARAHPVGTHLAVHSGADEKVTGTFDGIEPDGALRLRRNGDVDVIRAGDVEL
jgi:BirA family biotin operon repressor/biotin-[acetyl-CoA-carboxylase] ligase